MVKKLNIQKYEEILQRKELQPSYLDSFSLNSENLPKVSAIIPTFNRCPHPVKEDANPLAWCLESLLAQKSSTLDEIIVINDASTDYTEEVIKDFQKKYSLPIIHLENKENRGLAISRNIAAKKAKNEFLMFVDDDSVFSKFMIFGATMTLNNLGKNTAALQLPIYHRTTKPSLIDIKQIGALNLEEGIMIGNYNCFPKEYLNSIEDNFIDSNLKILKPFEIKNLGGVCLVRKIPFNKVGRFPENFKWKNSYRVETDFSLRLSENNYKIFFTPDPKFYCVHLKYGAKSNSEKINVSEPRLKRLITKSNIELKDNGCRVDMEEWFFDRIISDYVIIGIRNKEFANGYLNRVYQQFVIKNALSTSWTNNKIEDMETREAIFNRAIIEGNKLIGTRI